MTIRLYRNISENNKVTKTLQDMKEYNGAVRDATNVLTPSVLIESTDDLSQYNYMYIVEFHRYYFISDLQATRTRLWTIGGEVDVLMSYATQIKSLSAIIGRQASNYNLNLEDTKVKTLNQVSIQGKQLGSAFNRETTYGYVLVVAGKSDVSTSIA
jgi:hypothetical protein